ncbi:MAG: hypothetical protein R3E96_14870 [Planctomycetota bacterium]
MFKSLLLAACLMASGDFAFTQSDALPATPAGWKVTRSKSAGTSRFRPEDREGGQIAEVVFYDRSLLEGYALERWLAYRVQALEPPRGKAVGPWEVKKLTANFAMANRKFESMAGEAGEEVAMAACVDGQWARVAVASFLPASLSGKGKYGKVSTALLTGLLEVEKEAAKKDGRGIEMEVAPPKVDGLQAGGELRPGRYVGNGVTAGEGDIRAHYDLAVYENGEYEFLNGTNHGESGYVNYSPATGRLNIKDDLYNSKYEPTEDFCVYGVGKDGVPQIYSEDYWGLGTTVARLRWTGPVEEPSPRRRKLLEEWQKAMAKRYPHRVEPGKGIRPEELKGIVYTTRLEMDGVNTFSSDNAYVLLNDGRVFDGLPVAPDELDLPASRAREGDRWGWWKQEGDGFVFAWEVRKGEFGPPQGIMGAGQPVPKGTRLEGNWASASSWSMGGMGGGGANFWGLILNDNGRFQTWRNGISGAGGVPGWDVMTAAVWNDEGSSVSASGVGVVVYSKSHNGTSEDDRSGTYEFDGYALNLHYDSGREEREPVFTSGEDRHFLWFRGDLLALKKEDGK